MLLSYYAHCYFHEFCDYLEYPEDFFFDLVQSIRTPVILIYNIDFIASMSHVPETGIFCRRRTVFERFNQSSRTW